MDKNTTDLSLYRTEKTLPPRPLHIGHDKQLLCDAGTSPSPADQPPKTARRLCGACARRARPEQVDPDQSLLETARSRSALLRPHHLPLGPYRDQPNDWSKPDEATFLELFRAVNFTDRRDLDPASAAAFRRQLEHASIRKWVEGLLRQTGDRMVHFLVLHASPSFYVRMVPDRARRAHHALNARPEALRPLSLDMDRLTVVSQLVNTEGVRPVAERLLVALNDRQIQAPALRVMLETPSFFPRLRRQAKPSQWRRFCRRAFDVPALDDDQPDSFFHETTRRQPKTSRSTNARKLRSIMRSQTLNAPSADRKLRAFRNHTRLTQPDRVRYVRHRDPDRPDWVKRLFKRLNRRYLHNLLPDDTPIARTSRDVVATAVHPTIGTFRADGRPVEYCYFGIDLGLSERSIYLPGALLHEMIHLSVRHRLIRTRRFDAPGEHEGRFRIYARLTGLPVETIDEHWPVRWLDYRPWARRQLRAVQTPRPPRMTP